MSEQVMPFAGGLPDFLSLVNAEVEKVEPTIKVPLTPPDEEPPSIVPPESLPTPTERSKEVQHLKASNFTEPTYQLTGCHNLFKTIFVLLQNRTDAHRTLS